MKDEAIIRTNEIVTKNIQSHYMLENDTTKNHKSDVAAKKAYVEELAQWRLRDSFF